MATALAVQNLDMPIWTEKSDDELGKHILNFNE
jgi:hypothetical protein